MTLRGWLCARCGRSYAPHVSECAACNEPKARKQLPDFGIQPVSGSFHMCDYDMGSTVPRCRICGRVKPYIVPQGWS